MTEPFDLAAEVCWPTTFFHRRWRDHAAEAPGIIDLLYQERAGAVGVASGVARRAKSAAGLYESGFDLFSRPHPGLAKLVQFIGQSVVGAVTALEGGRIRPGQLGVHFAESWFHITNAGGYHDAHFHHNCSWCGIYYLQLGVAGPSRTAAPNGGAGSFPAGGRWRIPGRRDRLPPRRTRPADRRRRAAVVPVVPATAVSCTTARRTAS